MAEPPRRFPTPWRADKITGGYVVRDANGQMAFLYSHQDPNAAATLAAELRRDTPRDAAGGCAGKTARDYTVDIGHADGQAG
jgi:hypothetical protein